MYVYTCGNKLFVISKVYFICATIIGSLTINHIQLDYSIPSHIVKEVKLEVLYLYCLEVTFLVPRKRLSFLFEAIKSLPAPIRHEQRRQQPLIQPAAVPPQAPDVPPFLFCSVSLKKLKREI